MHLAFLLRNAFAFPNLKVVSHVEKKARVASDIFYGIPSPSLDFTFTLDLPDEVVPSPAFPQLKTFDFPRRSIEKDYSCQRFCFLSFRWLTIRGRENFVFVDRIVDLKKRYPSVENFIVLESGADPMKADDELLDELL